MVSGAASELVASASHCSRTYTLTGDQTQEACGSTFRSAKLDFQLEHCAG